MNNNINTILKRPRSGTENGAFVASPFFPSTSTSTSTFTSTSTSTAHLRQSSFIPRITTWALSKPACFLPSTKQITATTSSSELNSHSDSITTTENHKQPETCILVGVELTTHTQTSTVRIFDLESSLQELEKLCETAGLNPISTLTQNLPTPDPSTYIRSGKISELRTLLTSMKCCTVVFDVDLSPSQQRTIENSLSTYPTNVISVIDRTALILDIFAKHAATKEAHLQIELALYRYRLPRLTKLWTHLERQSGSGGVGLRGPGETQLEVDRRIISNRVIKLNNDIIKVKKHRQRLRKGRETKKITKGIPVLSLIGYTNAGKSSLLNALTGAYHVHTEDKLFATVDPTSRLAKLPGLNMSPDVIVTDTVGFVQNLPTLLVAAFAATLEEVLYADLLIHVVDASVNKQVIKWQMDAVDNVMKEIGATNKPVVVVFNKMDLVKDRSGVDEIIKDLNDNNDDVVSIVEGSIKHGGKNDIHNIGMAIEEGVRQALVVIKCYLPYGRGDLNSEIYRVGCVLDEEFDEKGSRLLVKVPGWLLNKLKPYIVHDDDDNNFNGNSDFKDDDDDDERQEWNKLAKKRPNNIVKDV